MLKLEEKIMSKNIEEVSMNILDTLLDNPKLKKKLQDEVYSIIKSAMEKLIENPKTL